MCDSLQIPAALSQLWLRGDIDEIIERFEIGYIPEPNSGCWLWLGCGRQEYGTFCVGNRKIGRYFTGAHRIAFQLFVGDIPEGIEVCHSCDVGCCVNPGHLFAGTRADNMRDCVAKGRHGHNPAMLGATNIKAKLVPAQVIAIRCDGRSLSKVAADYGVSIGTVSKIKRREIWSHLEAA